MKCVANYELQYNLNFSTCKWLCNKTLYVCLFPSENGKIEFVEFFAYMTANYRTRDQYNHDLKEAFKTFDKNNDGFIEAKELHKVMVGIGERLTFEEAQQMIHDADINGDGQINFEGRATRHDATHSYSVLIGLQ